MNRCINKQQAYIIRMWLSGLNTLKNSQTRPAPTKPQVAGDFKDSKLYSYCLFNPLFCPPNVYYSRIAQRYPQELFPLWIFRSNPSIAQFKPDEKWREWKEWHTVIPQDSWAVQRKGPKCHDLKIFFQKLFTRVVSTQSIQ